MLFILNKLLATSSLSLRFKTTRNPAQNQCVHPFVTPESSQSLFLQILPSRKTFPTTQNKTPPMNNSISLLQKYFICLRRAHPLTPAITELSRLIVQITATHFFQTQQEVAAKMIKSPQKAVTSPEASNDQAVQFPLNFKTKIPKHNNYKMPVKIQKVFRMRRIAPVFMHLTQSI